MSPFKVPPLDEYFPPIALLTLFNVFNIVGDINPFDDDDTTPYVVLVSCPGIPNAVISALVTDATALT